MPSKASKPAPPAAKPAPSLAAVKGAKAAPVPLVTKGTPVDWWFAFKFNAQTYPGVPKASGEQAGIFGGKIETYDGDARRFSQTYAAASSADPVLKLGSERIGTTVTDPLGATFGQVYDGDFYYVVWNDQFYGNPIPKEFAPWGHSKGLLAWNDAGEGFVLQVSTPSWPASGSRRHPRQNDGNTLGYVNDDDIEVSQHFFALKLSADDVQAVVEALLNAGVVTNPSVPALANNGGPQAIARAVAKLGKLPPKGACTVRRLSSGATLISKPASLAVPPWQLVSASLGGVDLRVASWWTTPEIYSTTGKTLPGCWGAGLGNPGAVQIATTGTWQGRPIDLKGGEMNNHAKIGASTDASRPYAIFGDMNQQGALCEGYDTASQNCSSSQNGRGGLFFVLEDKKLHAQVSALLAGESAPVKESLRGSATRSTGR
jgi:hypothetical protein